MSSKPIEGTKIDVKISVVGSEETLRTTGYYEEAEIDASRFDEYVAVKKKNVDLLDSIFFYDKESKKVLVVEFDQLPGWIKEAHENHKKIQVEGKEPLEFERVALDDETDELVMGYVNIIGPDGRDLSKIEAELSKKVRGLFGVKRGDKIDKEKIAEIVNKILGECPEVQFLMPRPFHLQWSSTGKVDFTVIVLVKRPHGVTVQGLADGDPLKEKVEGEFGDKYFVNREQKKMAPQKECVASGDLIIFIEKAMEEDPDAFYVKDYTYEGRWLRKKNCGLEAKLRKYEKLDIVEIVGTDKEGKRPISAEEEAEVKKYFSGIELTKGNFNEALKNLTAYYAKNGKIITKKSEAVRVEGEFKIMTLTYEVQEAPRSLKIGGDIPIKDKEIKRKIEKLFGDLKKRVYTPAEIDKKVKELKEFIVDLGYQLKDVKEDYSIVDGELILNLEAVRIAKIEIHEVGKKKKLKRRVYRNKFVEWEGDFFNEKRFNQGWERVIKTKLVGKAEDVAKRKPAINFDEDGDAIIDMDFEPDRNLNLHGGLGGGALKSMGGGLGVGLKGFGRGEDTIGIDLGLMGSGYNISLGYGDPDIFGDGWGAYFNVFHNGQSLDDYFWNIYDEGKGFTETGITTKFHLPIAGKLSPWHLWISSTEAYYDYYGMETPGSAWFWKPSTSLEYDDTPYRLDGGSRQVSLDAAYNVGGQETFPELNAMYNEQIQLGRTFNADKKTANRFYLGWGAAAGHKFVDSDDVTWNMLYNQFNTPMNYGDQFGDFDAGNSYTHLGLGVGWELSSKMLGFEVGLTGGGRGDTWEDMLGLGVGAKVTALGSLTFGVGYDFFNGFGWTLGMQKTFSF